MKVRERQTWENPVWYIKREITVFEGYGKCTIVFYRYHKKVDFAKVESRGSVWNIIKTQFSYSLKIVKNKYKEQNSTLRFMWR